MSFNPHDSSDDEEDEFIAKIKAAAARKEKIAVTSSIQDLIPSVLKEDELSTQDKTANSFFVHATEILAKEKAAMERVQGVHTIEDDGEDDSEENTDTEEVTESTTPQVNITATQLESEADTPSSADENEDEIRVVGVSGAPPNGDTGVIFLDDSPEPVPIPQSPTVEPDIDDEVTIRIKVDGKLEKFTVGENESFEGIFKALAQKLHSSVNEFMLLRHGIEKVNPSDTPRGLGLAAVEILELARNIVTPSSASGASSVGHKRKANDGSSVTLKFQTGDRKCLVELVVNKLDTFEIIKAMYVRERGLNASSANKLKFQFDGDKVSEQSTPTDLDMDDGDCIDVL